MIKLKFVVLTTYGSSLPSRAVTLYMLKCDVDEYLVKITMMTN